METSLCHPHTKIVGGAKTIHVAFVIFFWNSQKKNHSIKIYSHILIRYSYKRGEVHSVFLHKILKYKIDCPLLLNRIKIRVPTKYSRAPITPLHHPLRRTVLAANHPICSCIKVCPIQIVKLLLWTTSWWYLWCESHVLAWMGRLECSDTTASQKTGLQHPLHCFSPSEWEREFRRPIYKYGI